MVRMDDVFLIQEGVSGSPSLSMHFACPARTRLAFCLFCLGPMPPPWDPASTAFLPLCHFVPLPFSLLFAFCPLCFCTPPPLHLLSFHTCPTFPLPLLWISSFLSVLYSLPPFPSTSCLFSAFPAYLPAPHLFILFSLSPFRLDRKRHLYVSKIITHLM